MALTKFEIRRREAAHGKASGRVDALAGDADWQAVTSGVAELRLSRGTGAKRRELRMDFDFRGGKGFVIARRPLRRVMAESFSLNLRLRGPMSGNRIEIKLFDVSGESVWWHVEDHVHLDDAWRTVNIPSRTLDFAWGPAGGGRLAELGSIEIAVVAGSGGTGSLSIGQLEIADDPELQPATATASSQLRGHEAAAALDGRGWTPQPADRKPWISLDFGTTRSLGGLVIDWLSAAPETGFALRGSMDGSHWKLLRCTRRAAGPRSWVSLPDLLVRHLRLELHEPSHGAVLRPQAFEFSRTPAELWHNLAGSVPRGWFPRWLLREQSLWTPAAAAGHGSALINQDGLVEPFPGSFTLEPMLWSGDRLFTWDNVTVAQRLEGGWEPVPIVTWHSKGLELEIRLDALQSGAVRVSYQLRNASLAAWVLRLFVVVRPFQVTPPWQAFGRYGGVSRIHQLIYDGRRARVDDLYEIAPDQEASGFGAACFDFGPIGGYLAAGQLPPDRAMRDSLGYATGAFAFDRLLQPGEACSVALLSRGAGEPDAGAGDKPFDWERKLPVGQIEAPEAAMTAVRARLTACAHMLINRAGAALQPGPRRYTRAWIRDATTISSALLRVGCAEEVRAFIVWYMPFQRADGFVPCCVDDQGIEWRAEHDSHGEFICLVADYYGITRDRQLLDQAYPAVARAAAYMERSLEPQGLLPVSESHEGYSGNPVHAYWDDFWGLRGLVEAGHLAQVLGLDGDAVRWRAAAAKLEQGLYRSIELTRTARNLDYIPASSDLGDFDPMATANALSLMDVPAAMNRPALERSFDLYLGGWRQRFAGTANWFKYTPYEIRIIAALVRLGRRGDALEMLGFSLAERSPPAWNQWPEIAWRDRRAPAHLGDLPHTWIGAEFALAVESLYAYQRGPGGPLVLAAGLASSWIEGAGVRVHELPTVYGRLSYSMRRLSSNMVMFETTGVECGLVLRPPVSSDIAAVTLDGMPWSRFDHESVTLDRGPAHLVLNLAG